MSKSKITGMTRKQLLRQMRQLRMELASSTETDRHRFYERAITLGVATILIGALPLVWLNEVIRIVEADAQAFAIASRKAKQK